MNTRVVQKKQNVCIFPFRQVILGVHFDPPSGTVKICQPPLQGQKKNFFKVCLVGTLNLCLKIPKKMQKTRDEPDHSRLQKLPKTAKKLQNQNLANFCQFWTFSLSGMIRLIFNLLHLFRLLWTQVQSTHKAYFEEIFFCPFLEN